MLKLFCNAPLQMILAGGQAVTRMGTRFGTATTVASDTYLIRLYTKTDWRKADGSVLP